MWYWRRLLRVTWTGKRSNQSILKEISPEYSLEGLMLKLQSFGHLMWRTDHRKIPWCSNRFKARGAGDNTGWDGWMASLTLWTWFEQASGVCDGQWNLVCCSLWGQKESDMDQLNWCSFKPTKSVIHGTKLFSVISFDLPDSSVGNESACNAGDPGSIPGQEDLLKKV